MSYQQKIHSKLNSLGTCISDALLSGSGGCTEFMGWFIFKVDIDVLNDPHLLAAVSFFSLAFSYLLFWQFL